MADKPKCSTAGCEREAYSKGLCSGCYGKEWRKRRQMEREIEQAQPKQLTAGDVPAEMEPIQGEVIHPPETHLTATNPVEMAATTCAHGWNNGWR